MTPFNTTLLRPLLLVAFSLSLSAAGPEVTMTGPVTTDPDRLGDPPGTTQYQVTVEHVSCTMKFSPTEDAVLFFSEPVDATQQQLAACMSPVLQVFVHDHPAIQKLFVMQANRKMLSDRVTAALDTSPEWDHKAGKATHGSGLIKVLVDTINKYHLNQEIEAVFMEQGYSLKAVRVHDIYIERVSKFNNHRLPVGLGTYDFSAIKSSGGH